MGSGLLALLSGLSFIFVLNRFSILYPPAAVVAVSEFCIMCHVLCSEKFDDQFPRGVERMFFDLSLVNFLRRFRHLYHDFLSGLTCHGHFSLVFAIFHRRGLPLESSLSVMAFASSMQPLW